MEAAFLCPPTPLRRLAGVHLESFTQFHSLIHGVVQHLQSTSTKQLSLCRRHDVSSIDFVCCVGAGHHSLCSTGGHQQSKCTSMVATIEGIIIFGLQQTNVSESWNLRPQQCSWCNEPRQWYVNVRQEIMKTELTYSSLTCPSSTKSRSPALPSRHWSRDAELHM